MEGNFRLPKLLVQFYHRNTLVGPTSRQKPFENVIHIMGDAYMQSTLGDSSTSRLNGVELRLLLGDNSDSGR